MSVRFLMLALAAGILAAGPSVRADNARPRSGGSSSSSAGAQHHSGGSGNAHASGSSRGSSGSSSSHDNASAPPSGRSQAEQRHPRAGTGTGDWPYHGHGYYPGYYPGWYYPYWPSYYYGAYAGWGPYGGYYGPGPVYYSYRSGGDSAALRVLVDPEKTKVYVDGYYAGVADDFDGMFQRLYLAPGRHEITLKLDGYRTHRMLVYVLPGQTMKIERDLEKGPGDETFEDLTGGRGAREETVERRPDRDYDQPGDRYEPEAAPPPSRGGDEPYRSDAGRVRLDIRPRDASVYVDGQFQGPAGDLGELTLPPGPHRVEVVRPGFRTEERDVQVAPGGSRTVTIELARP